MVSLLGLPQPERRKGLSNGLDRDDRPHEGHAGRCSFEIAEREQELFAVSWTNPDEAAGQYRTIVLEIEGLASPVGVA